MASRDIEGRPQRTPLARRAVAGLVLAGVVVLAGYLAIHLVLAVLWVVVGIALVVAVLWALNTLL